MTGKQTTGAVDTQAPAEPRRLTPTERLQQVTLAALARGAAEAEHTVDISRSARGVWQLAVAVRGTDLDEVVRLAAEKAEELALRFPFVEPAGSAGSGAK